jgi:hypothetical protein
LAPGIRLFVLTDAAKGAGSQLRSQGLWHEAKEEKEEKKKKPETTKV